MNFLIEIKVCRCCLKPDETTKLTDCDVSSEIMSNFTCLVQTEVIVFFCSVVFLKTRKYSTITTWTVKKTNVFYNLRIMHDCQKHFATDVCQS